MMLDVVCAPGDQRYDETAGAPDGTFAVSVTLPPEQNVVEPEAEIVGVGFGSTVTVVGDEVPVQPCESVAVTE